MSESAIYAITDQGSSSRLASWPASVNLLTFLFAIVSTNSIQKHWHPPAEPKSLLTGSNGVNDMRMKRLIVG